MQCGILFHEANNFPQKNKTFTRTEAYKNILNIGKRMLFE